MKRRKLFKVNLVSGAEVKWVVADSFENAVKYIDSNSWGEIRSVEPRGYVDCVEPKSG